jgi:hypothetical protein
MRKMGIDVWVIGRYDQVVIADSLHDVADKIFIGID